MLDELVDLGLALAEDLDAPQDIEWALDGAGLWIVQARPITVAAGRVADDDGCDTEICGDDEYTSAGVGEMLPGTVRALRMRRRLAIGSDVVVEAVERLIELEVAP